MSKMEEIWKDIPNYEGIYQASNLGRIKSLKFGKERVLRHGLHKVGYCYIYLYKRGKGITNLVHRLVAIAFLGESDLQVNHKNGIKSDNRLENLEYCTGSENNKHAYDIGLKAGRKGENNPSSKLTRACVERIKYGHQGMTQRAIAEIYGITQSQVSLIRLGKNWKHI